MSPSPTTSSDAKEASQLKRPQDRAILSASTPTTTPAMPTIPVVSTDYRPRSSFSRTLRRASTAAASTEACATSIRWTSER